jgi:hypothetical protein
VVIAFASRTEGPGFKGEFFKRIFAPTEKLPPRREVGAFASFKKLASNPEKV